MSGCIRHGSAKVWKRFILQGGCVGVFCTTCLGVAFGAACLGVAFGVACLGIAFGAACLGVAFLSRKQQFADCRCGGGRNLSEVLCLSEVRCLSGVLCLSGVQCRHVVVYGRVVISCPLPFDQIRLEGGVTTL